MGNHSQIVGFNYDLSIPIVKFQQYLRFMEVDFSIPQACVQIGPFTTKE